MQDKTEEFFLQRLRTTLCRIIAHLLLVCPHLSLSGAPSLALLIPFLTAFCPNFGAWPDCWVSVKFFHAPSLGRGRVECTTRK